MDIKLKIINPHWKTICQIPRDSQLEKGRHGLYFSIVQSAGNVKSRFGCYAWGILESLYYIGSYSKDYKSACW